MKKITTVYHKKNIRKIKVAAYARVSSTTERTENSLETQMHYYAMKIANNPEWEYVGIYSDNGITGTAVKNREGFKALMKDCEAGKIDLVLTKSVSRFARNTVDLLNYCRKLKGLGIEVRFEKENISNMGRDGEVMLTLLASVAQEEILSISDNLKWAYHKKMEKGMPGCRFNVFGYRWEGDNLIPDPEEAEVVKMIYDNFLAGKSRLQTERELAAKGITTRKGCRFGDFSIKHILTNVVYKGDLLLQKYYVPKPSTHGIKNNGEVKQYYVEGHHEAIIDPDVFDHVQAEMARRAAEDLNYHTIYPMHNKVLCEACGRPYSRDKDGGRPLWCCRHKCGTKRVPEAEIEKAFCAVKGLEEFSADVFTDTVEYVKPIGKDLLEFHLKDGTVAQQHWKSMLKYQHILKLAEAKRNAKTI